MSDYSQFHFGFIKLPTQPDWIVLSPRRALRPNVAKQEVQVCPFCIGGGEDILYQIKSNNNDEWLIKVLPNKYPFAPIHELIIHSPDHHKNIDELPQEQIKLLFNVYKQRFNLHKDKGQVCIFHNRGVAGGESIPHPHTQLAVIPIEIPLNSPTLALIPQDAFRSEQFVVFSPSITQWPDEVWIAPRRSGLSFGEISEQEIDNLSKFMPRVIEILDLRHGHEFPFNFSIYFGKNWFVRIVPRQKILGGFEVSTGVYVNTQDPKETNSFLQEHLTEFNKEKILQEQQATYHRCV